MKRIDDLLGINTIAERISVNKEIVRRAAKCGELATVVIDGRFFVALKDAEEWKENVYNKQPEAMLKPMKRSVVFETESYRKAYQLALEKHMSVGAFIRMALDRMIAEEEKKNEY